MYSNHLKANEIGIAVNSNLIDFYNNIESGEKKYYSRLDASAFGLRLNLDDIDEKSKIFYNVESISEDSQWSHPFGQNDRYRIKIANDFETRRSAYELIYRLYREKEYAAPNDSGMWLSLYNLLPDTTTLVVMQEDEVVGTLSVVFDGPLGLPADKLYKEEIDVLRKAGRKPAEIISLGVADKGRRSSRDILVKLFNYVYLVSRHLKDATDFVITVNPHHAEYYQKTLLSEEWGTEHTYEKLGGAPAVLLRINLETPDRLKIPDRTVAEPHMEKLRKRTYYRFFHTTEQEQKILPNLEMQLDPMSEEEFYCFAMKKTDLWDHASPREKSYLSKHYFKAMMDIEALSVPKFADAVAA
ncbi:MAG: hypothetical protein LWW97_03890 [Deltaproteobacteria bacterium]|nr:hypothetical protein [Deltaproteobacteria bacterium]